MAEPREIVVLSGKGGTGKTIITAAFATMASNAVFADCDVDASDLHLILSSETYHQEKFASGPKASIDPDQCITCDICRDLCHFNAIEITKDILTVNEYACEGCGLCSLACPVGAIEIQEFKNNRIFYSNCRFGPIIYGNLGAAEENSGKLVTKIKKCAYSIALYNKADFIIIDGPPGIGCPVIASLTGSDLVVAVTEPTISGWHDLIRLIELAEKFHTCVLVIINKYDLNMAVSENIKVNLIRKGIPVVGKLPYDDSVIHALLEGKTITEFQPGGKIADELSKIWESITSRIDEPQRI